MNPKSFTTRVAVMLFGAMRRLLGFASSPIGICLAIVIFGVTGAALPNVFRWMEKNHGYPTVSEINNIELTLTKIISDAGRSSLQDLFDPVAFEKTCTWYELQYGADTFEARTAISTRAAYALIKSGRGAILPQAQDDDIMTHTRKVLATDVVDDLGTSYYPGVGNDPWGNPYQIFAGPWPKEMGLLLFRSYDSPGPKTALPGNSSMDPNADVLTVTVAEESPGTRGYPATPYHEAYIWSLGANGVSDQPRYDPTHQYAPPVRHFYRSDAPEEYLGGGDDINNWDKNQTFMRFYN